MFEGTNERCVVQSMCFAPRRIENEHSIVFVGYYVDTCVKVDSHQRTNVPRFYAAGDIVIGLDQISHAMGEGGVAATTIRNDLARQRPLLREPLREVAEA